MAILKFENGEILANLDDIQHQLTSLNIHIAHHNLAKSFPFPDLLIQDALSSLEKEQIIQSHKSEFELLQQQRGYFCYDLLVLHPGSANLYALTTTYSRYHTHQDAETLHILAGEALFSFVQPDASQIQLLVQAGDYIHIPAGVEHWFSPSASLQLKAWRYFTSADGWIPYHTGTQLQDTTFY